MSTSRKGYRKCARCGTNRQLRFYVGTRGRVCSTCRKKKTRSASRAKRLLDTYGITSEEYDLLLQAQGGACAGCREKRSYNLSVDHDHQVEANLRPMYADATAARMSVRGLLCRRCNKVLRDVRDNDATLDALADYLANWPSNGVLKGRWGA